MKDNKKAKIRLLKMLLEDINQDGEVPIVGIVRGYDFQTFFDISIKEIRKEYEVGIPIRIELNGFLSDEKF